MDTNNLNDFLYKYTTETRSFFLYFYPNITMIYTEIVFKININPYVISAHVEICAYTKTSLEFRCYDTGRLKFLFDKTKHVIFAEL